MGGIATINDVLEFIMAGATGIAIGTANFNNPFVMPEIISELSKYMKENNVETLDEIRVLLVKNQEEIIMHYTGTIWRPPYEAYSLLVQVTAGCTHHSCKFCTLYEDLPFNLHFQKLKLAWQRQVNIIEKYLVYFLLVRIHLY